MEKDWWVPATAPLEAAMQSITLLNAHLRAFRPLLTAQGYPGPKRPKLSSDIGH